MRRIRKLLRRSAVLIACVALAPMMVMSGAAPPAHATVATVSNVDGPLTRMQITLRARDWVNAQPTYSMSAYFPGPDADGKVYRTDCSGFVSMAWHLGKSYDTTTLDQVSYPIAKDDLKMGDIVLAKYGSATIGTGHVVLFDKWLNTAHTSYMGYEFGSTPPVYHSITYPHGSDDRVYAPYRYDKVLENNQTVGWFRPADNSVHLLKVNSKDSSTIPFPIAGDGDIQAVSGDWDGNGIDTPGWFRPLDGRWCLLPKGGQTCPTSAAFTIPSMAGHPNYHPIAGDWNGDGIDTVGFYDSFNGSFHLFGTDDPSNLQSTVFSVSISGFSVMKPFVIDWNGDGKDTVGLYNPAGIFNVFTANSGTATDLQISSGAGADGSVIPIAGDWFNEGVDRLGWYRQNDQSFHLMSNSGPNLAFALDAPDATATPLVGNWQTLI